MLIQVQTKNEWDQFHIFQCTCFKGFRIYPQAIMYHFEYTSHDKHQYFLILVLQIILSMRLVFIGNSF